MTRLTWDDPGTRRFETGVDRGVLYPSSGPGVPWNGLISVEESPSGGDPTPYYLDGVKYANVPSVEEFSGVIEAYTYPSEFDASNGARRVNNGMSLHQQRRQAFGLSYRTKIGNDLDGSDHGYKIHLVYKALASPSQNRYTSVGDNPDAITFSWNFTTTPVSAGLSYRPLSHVAIDSTKTPRYLLDIVEKKLYGSEDNPPELPSLAELVTLFSTYADFSIILSSTGTYIISGNPFVREVSPGRYEISHENVVNNGDGTVTVNGLDIPDPTVVLDIELFSDGTYAADGTAVTELIDGEFAIDHETVVDNGDGSFTIV